jgi:hypothetical protein
MCPLSAPVNVRSSATCPLDDEGLDPAEVAGVPFPHAIDASTTMAENARARLEVRVDTAE